MAPTGTPTKVFPKVFRKDLVPFAPSSFLLLVAMPGAPSSVLAPSSKARSPE